MWFIKNYYYCFYCKYLKFNNITTCIFSHEQILEFLINKILTRTETKFSQKKAPVYLFLLPIVVLINFSFVFEKPAVFGRSRFLCG